MVVVESKLLSLWIFKLANNPVERSELLAGAGNQGEKNIKSERCEG